MHNFWMFSLCVWLIALVIIKKFMRVILIFVKLPCSHWFCCMFPKQFTCQVIRCKRRLIVNIKRAFFINLGTEHMKVPNFFKAKQFHWVQVKFRLSCCWLVYFFLSRHARWITKVCPCQLERYSRCGVRRRRRGVTGVLEEERSYQPIRKGKETSSKGNN